MALNEGPFQGVMAPTTPRGSYVLKYSAPPFIGLIDPSSLSAKPAHERKKSGAGCSRSESAAWMGLPISKLSNRASSPLCSLITSANLTRTSARLLDGHSDQQPSLKRW